MSVTWNPRGSSPTIHLSLPQPSPWRRLWWRLFGVPRAAPTSCWYNVPVGSGLSTGKVYWEMRCEGPVIIETSTERMICEPPKGYVPWG